MRHDGQLAALWTDKGTLERKSLDVGEFECLWRQRNKVICHADWEATPSRTNKKERNDEKAGRVIETVV
ncbi:hypothetical protein CEXT_462921 [Caerostris extrusa]|uniref:Uncharacterized protein n=1 Tax=Caerostris extrusa TaxID=172846 RepID=A0AAV4THK9_CAEEX|nr:hypothetical protein CEXT_462921 [Caerostris extrusa]